MLRDLRYGQSPRLFAPGELSIVRIVGVAVQQRGDSLLGGDVGDGEPVEQYAGRLFTSGGQRGFPDRVARCLEFSIAHIHADSFPGIADGTGGRRVFQYP